MSACSQCGTVVKPSDKFCNVCGSPIARANVSAPPPVAPYAPTAFAPAPPPPPNYAGGPSPQAPAYGGGGVPGAPPARCQLGHEIPPGASYCAQGHPIALEQMQFANDAYGGGYGGAPPAPNYAPGAPAAYAAPTQAAPGGPYGTPPPPAPYGSPPQGPQAYGAPPAQDRGYVPAQGQPGYGVPGYGQQPVPYGQQASGAHAAPQATPYAFPPDANRNASGAPPGFSPPVDAPAKVLRGFLVTYGTNATGDFWPLTAGRLIVGRFGTGDGLDIAMHDPTISSRHAALVVDGPNATVSIEDTGSTNGTFVNDEHIGYGGRRELRDGDRLRFGGFTTVVKVIGRV